MVLAQIKESEIEALVNDLEALKEQDEETLFEVIGNGLHDEGYKVLEDDSLGIVEENVKQNQGGISLKMAFEHVKKSDPLSTEEASNNGKKFMKRFNEKLRKLICSNERLSDIMKGNGSLKDFLMVGIPLGLGAIGIAALNPVWLAIIGSVLAIILKAGYQAYCEVD
jgi:hypothetical protein